MPKFLSLDSWKVVLALGSADAATRVVHGGYSTSSMVALDASQLYSVLKKIRPLREIKIFVQFFIFNKYIECFTFCYRLMFHISINFFGVNPAVLPKPRIRL
ncbi:hypothetical protein WN51_04228 [Melipona quadrifasciata]|uniref:Uncharacterized protein n=1 Tax=Melipona quadrifasciata TaxID=166423 RepID=A0A0M8ZU54_9HYME|nr:hypothetical protein WN51_04228 [Melipona quadrifasciata]